jgi:diaminohydroxyphosphoribosylaminopyrimidine deaminase/5-amino-6-(5-phosphoribosylamino)uracil reductase
MSLALELAANGLYTTQPNPRVGCVIAKNSTVISTGWHQRTGGPHAEVFALKSADKAADGATAYVTLEPCSHTGRTPPCAEALINAGIKRVVIATKDPNPQVNGDGCLRLESAGLKVECGLMSEDAQDLNVGFFKRMRTGQPWVRVKIASSLDGRTALKNGDSKWISNEASRHDVQTWRARASAILTGIGTVLADDPRMTARVEEPLLHPLRVIVDSKWRTPVRSRILADPSRALIVGDENRDPPEALLQTGVSLLPLETVEGKINLQALMKYLAEREMNEIQVEAGARLCGALLLNELVDEILLYQAPVLLGDGAPGLFSIGVLESMSEKKTLERLAIDPLGCDLRMRFRAISKLSNPVGEQA